MGLKNRSEIRVGDIDMAVFKTAAYRCAYPGRVDGVDKKRTETSRKRHRLKI